MPPELAIVQGTSPSQLTSPTAMRAHFERQARPDHHAVERTLELDDKHRLAAVDAQAEPAPLTDREVDDAVWRPRTRPRESTISPGSDAPGAVARSRWRNALRARNRCPGYRACPRRQPVAFRKRAGLALLEPPSGNAGSRAARAWSQIGNSSGRARIGGTVKLTTVAAFNPALNIMAGRQRIRAELARDIP